MSNKDISIDKIIELTSGKVLSRGSVATIKNFCSDTRNINKGDMFISLKSEKNDGIEYIKEAFQKGACGCITEYSISDEILKKYCDRIIIEVKDIIVAIQEIAKFKRSLFNIPVIAVTGSVGKTSTKDIIANVISQEYNVNKTQGNYNNHIGVPLTILSWNENTEAAIIEMGMNHFREIFALTNIAKPTVAIITNIGTAHIGNLGSRENILKAKLEILEGLSENGAIVLNNDNDLLNTCNTKQFRKVTYGIKNTSDFTAKDIVLEEMDSYFKINVNNEEFTIKVPVAGEHFIYNTLCAIAVGRELGIEMEKIINGIQSFELTSKRNEIIEKNGLIIINDYYNASYDSMKASLEVLTKTNGKRKIAILGDMLELGDFSEELHREVGIEVAKNKINILFTVGSLAKDMADEAKKQGIEEVYSFDTNKECINELKKVIKKNDSILLKASNRMNFGEISEFIQGDKLWEK